jgi:uncharacterized integral membrane protein
MKAFKLVVFLLVCVFLVIVVMQNQDVFMDKKALEIDLIAWKYQSQAIHLSLYFLGFFLVGLLVSYVHGLGERFKTKRLIASQLETIRNAEEEIRTLRSQPNADHPNAEQEIASPDNGVA